MTDPVIMTLDQAPSNTGWAIGKLWDRKPIYGKLDLPPWGDDEPQRVKIFFRWLWKTLNDHGVTHLFYEKDVPNAGRGKAIMSTPKRGPSRPIIVNQKDPAITLNQNACIAMIWYAAAEAGIPVQPIDVNDMRDRFIGTRRIPGLQGEAHTKELKLHALKACALRGWLVSDHNVAEALGHLDFAFSVVDPKNSGAHDILSRRTELQFWNGER